MGEVGAAKASRPPCHAGAVLGRSGQAGSKVRVVFSRDILQLYQRLCQIKSHSQVLVLS